MRTKIIAVNLIVLLIVGVCAFALLQMSLGDAKSNPARSRETANRILAAANTKLELDALRTERWLSTLAGEDPTRAVFEAGTTQARADAATEQANRIRAALRGKTAGVAVSLVAFVDAQGLVLGRDGTNLMRGEDVGAAHPSIRAAIAAGQSASDVWSEARSAALMLVSYAPVRSAKGKVQGLIVLGTPLSDNRLEQVGVSTPDYELLLAIRAGDQLDVKAKTGSASGLAALLAQNPTRDAALATLASGSSTTLPGGPPDRVLAAAPLGGYGDGTAAMLVAAVPSRPLPTAGLLWPIAGAVALGLVLVLVGGWLLGNYFSRPIEQIEEGLFAIMNGRTEHRIDVQHAELGGLAFRINSLLNQLMGVPEDAEEGGPSSRNPKPPADFASGI